MLKCERSTEAPPGMVRVKMADAGALFNQTGARGKRPEHRNGKAAGRSGGSLPKQPAPGPDWAHEAAAFTAALTSGVQAKLAADLGVSDAALAALGCGWASRTDLRRLRASGAGWAKDYPDGAFTFPERDGGGRIIGLSLRAADGRKGAPAGASRGLIVPPGSGTAADPVLILEGASDVAACCTAALASVGRPSSAVGAHLLAPLLEGRSVLVVGERDQKDGGQWPGRNGARSLAGHLAAEWGEKVSWALPPEGIKDVRTWLQARVAAGLNINDAAACRAAGVELLAALAAAARLVKPKRERPPADAELIVRLAEERFRLGRTAADEPFAVRLGGPNVAIMLRGSSEGLRSALAREFRRAYGRVPGASALADAMLTLQGAALDAEPEAVALRVAEYDGGIVLDLGGPDGRAVVIRPGMWEVAEIASVLFRRTALTAVLPEPAEGGELSELRGLLNVAEDSWPLVLGFLVAAFFPSIPHPILMLGGLQGTGKTTAAVFLAGLFDPSAADNHNVPRDPEAWAMAASGSWAVTVDNVSGISDWWADALCKAVTGAGWVRRKLYTDSDLSVLNFRRVVMLTSIDAGALRGDLADRMLIVDLEPISDGRRRDERKIRASYTERRPAIVGALLHLAAAVLRELPSVELASMPRMADFARILAAMDRVLGTDALGLYLGQRERIAGDVVDADPIGAAVAAFAARVGDWSGPAGALWKCITPDPAPADWPKCSRGFGGKLRRLIPALAQVGVDLTPPRQEGQDPPICAADNRPNRPTARKRPGQPPAQPPG